MHKKFGINLTKIKGSCQSGRKVVTHNSKSDLPPASCSPPSFPLCGNDIKGPVLVSTFFLPSESARTNEQRTLLDSIDVLIYNQSYNFDIYL